MFAIQYATKIAYLYAITLNLLETCEVIHNKMLPHIEVRFIATSLGDEMGSCAIF